MTGTRTPPVAPPQCPIRPGEACMLCQPGGPENCGLVYLVMTDPTLRDELRRRTLAWRIRESGRRAG